MNTLYVRLAIIGLSCGLTLLWGCCASQTVTPSGTTMAVELKESGTLDMYSVNLERQDDTTIVSGLIRQRGVTPSTAYSHVEVEVVKPDGRVAYQTRSETIAVPRHTVGKGMKHKSFQIPLNVAQDQLDPADHIVLKACANSQCRTKPI
jgi:hypothetical protein